MCVDWNDVTTAYDFRSSTQLHAIYVHTTAVVLNDLTVKTGVVAVTPIRRQRNRARARVLDHIYLSPERDSLS